MGAAGSQAGVRLAEYFSAADMALMSDRPSSLKSGLVEAVDGNGEAHRVDGGKLRLH